MQMLSLQYRLLFDSSNRACMMPESRLRPPGAPTLPPPTRSQSSEGDDNTKVLHTGGWVCILWVTEQRPRQQCHVIHTSLPSHPRFPYTSSGISKQRGGTLLKAPGVLVDYQHKMHLLFFTIPPSQ